MTTARRTRAVSLGSAVLVLGIGFHALAGGAVPAPLWLAVLVAVTIAAAWRLTARRLGAAGWVLATVGGQALVHGFLTATAGHGHADPGITDPVALALHRIGEDLTVAHAPMVLAHAAAAAGVGLWLAFGDRVLSLLTSVLAQWWRRTAPIVTLPATESAPAPVSASVVVPVGSVHRTPLTRRGPPALRSA